jgi:hypothetical protein
MRTLSVAGLLVLLSALAAPAGHAQVCGTLQSSVREVDLQPSSRVVQAALGLPRAMRGDRVPGRRDLAGTTILLDRPPLAADSSSARRVTIIHW